MEATKLPEVYYDQFSGGYWLKTDARRFLRLGTDDLKLHLRLAGLRKDEMVGPLNQLEKATTTAQLERAVDYAGPLAGHRCGLMETTDGRRILVTSEPKDVFTRSTADPECPHLEKFFGQLVGPVQLPFLLGWLKFARASLLAGDFRPGQMLALAGESGCGKSLLQALITEFLGGRMAKPYRYMTAQTPFNADLAGAEHLMIEDECASTDIRTRRAFGTAIKDFTVNSTQSIHAKGRTAVTLTTYKRLTLSVNNEPENLAILPPFDGSLDGKIILLKCAPARLAESREENWRKLAGELPNLAAYLQRWRVPKSLAEDRCGIKAYHHPELLEALNELAPEFRLLSLIDQCVKEFPWSGSAEALEVELRNASGGVFRWSIERLLPYPSACGTYLGRLAQKLPDRVRSTRSKGKTRWYLNAG